MLEGLEGSAKLAAIREQNLRRAKEHEARIAHADTVVDRRFGAAQPTIEAAPDEAEEYTGADAAGEIDVSDLRAELAGRKERREITPETNLADIGRGKAASGFISTEVFQQVKEQLRAQEEKQIAEIRQAIGQIGEEETSAVSPWKPDRKNTRYGGSATNN